MTGLHVRLIAVVVALLAWPSAAGASGITGYTLRLTMDGRGDAAARLDLSATLADSTLIVPLATAEGTDLRVVKAPPDATLTLSSRDGRGVLLIEMPLAARSVEITVEFGVPGAMSVPSDGTLRVLRHQLLNTQPTAITNYRVSVVFPAGWRAQAVREGQPRVRLGAVDGQAGATSETASLKQGDAATMRIELVERQRSFGWLVVGLLLACGYLFSFRDLVRPSGR